MVEVKFVGSTANNTLSSIALPNLQLYLRRDNTAPLCLCVLVILRSLFARNVLNSDELEFEHQPVAGRFFPRIYQVEVAVIRPYTLLDLFIDPNDIRIFRATFYCWAALWNLPFSERRPEGKYSD
jgi:hypothetical protein